MPRPPPKTGSANWTAQHHRLGDDAREKLIDALGLDPSINPDDLNTANQALAEVEKWLGWYPGADTALKNAPKASDFVRSLSSIENDTIKLLRNLKGVHQWVRDEFARTGIEFQELYQKLEMLRDTSLSIKSNYDGIESRGPPLKGALRDLILTLREVFDRFYQGPILPRRRIGFVKPLTEYEAAEVEFIKFCLDDAGILCSKEELRRLLDEPNVTVKAGRRNKIYSEHNIRRARDEQLKSLEKKKKKEKK